MEEGHGRDPRLLRPGVPARLRRAQDRRLLLNTVTIRQAGAEVLGTGLLVTVVVGSGIAAQRLSPQDIGLQLLENSLATALGLTVLIWTLGAISGGHLNPVVTLADRLLGGRQRFAAMLGYLAAQVVGAIAGCVLANAMFGTATALSTKDRATPGSVLGEIVATAGLVLVVFLLSRAGRTVLIAPAVGAYIGAAYWFTSSTAFANPAVTIGRMFSDTFAGIAPASVPWFLGGQLLGGALGIALVLLLAPSQRKATP